MYEELDYQMGIRSRRNASLDWCGTQGQGRTPRSHPYNFDDHFLFREVAKNARGYIDDAEAYYTDRMREWDREKAARALKGFSDFGTRPSSLAQAKNAAKIFFGDDANCVAYALSCNQSSGYPIGVFFIRHKTG